MQAEGCVLLGVRGRFSVLGEKDSLEEEEFVQMRLAKMDDKEVVFNLPVRVRH